MRIVIIDDDPVNRLILKNQFEAEHHEVTTASDGEQGCILAESVQPHLCVVDWVLPQMNGLDVVRHLRNTPSTSRCYIVMLTAKSKTSDLVQALDIGADDFMSKPICKSELSARLRAAARLISLQTDLDEKIEETTKLNHDLRQMNEQLRQLATTDSLTGLANRRSLLESVEQMWSAWLRYRRPLSLAMIDIDHFKQINDTHGHDIGDKVIQHITQLLSEGIRSEDMLGRYGGEEFALALPFQDSSEAAIGLRRMMANIRETPFVYQGLTLPVTVSMGVAAAAPSMQSYMDLFRASDEALYQAKRAGRDQVVQAQSPAYIPSKAV